jgi:putative ABC transport system permease protein
MSNFLGIPMTVVAVAALALLALVVGLVAFVRYRQPILFEIGVRNIPRRRAQSTLIVLGLMLSTVIFAAALSTGDTVTYSITNDTYQKLGRVDEIVQARSNSLKPRFDEEQIAPVGIVTVEDIDNLFAGFNGNEQVDGVLPALRFPAPVGNPQKELTEPSVVIMGLDPRQMAGFQEDLVTPDGVPVDMSQLDRTEVVVNESAAKALQLVPGQQLEIWVSGAPRSVRVQGIVRDRYITGWTLRQPAGVVMTLETAQFLFALPIGQTRLAGVSIVAISNSGGVRDTLGRSKDVTQAAIDTLGTSRLQVVSLKADRIEQAKAEGANLTTIFVVLGLFTVAAGMLLVFLILVMLAAERRTEMGMSRAVGMRRMQLIQSFMAEGMAYSLASAALGVALGIAVSVGMARAMRYIFSASDVAIAFHVEPWSLVIAYAIGVVLTFVTVVASAWRVSRLSIVAAIRETGEAPAHATGKVSGAAGGAAVLLGAALAAWGLRADQAAILGGGASLAILGLAMTARALGQRERPVFTLAGTAVVALWVLVAGGNLEPITGRMETGLATFFVGGMLMVAAATIGIIYNADVLLGGVRAVGAVFARAAPAVRTAVAYPLSNRFRTGTTIAMLSLVVFALVMISTMNLNFRRLFLDPDAQGGWDVVVTAQPSNPISQDDRGNRLGPMGEALDRAFFDTRRIDKIAQVQVVNPRTTTVAQLTEDGRARKTKAYQIYGVDEEFLDENKIGLQARAAEYGSDREVWQALKDDPANAVIDGSVVAGINYGNLNEQRFVLEDFPSGTTSFEPIELGIQDTATGEVRVVRLIGIMKRGSSTMYRGLWMNEAGLASQFPPLQQAYYVRMREGEDAAAAATEIEQALARYGVAADSIRQQVEDDQALSNAFFMLVQGFLAIGLGVGLVALSVIAFRTVVERRQQIGLMRAIGFTRASIALSFVLESAFVAALGIANGIWPALLLANRLLASDEFSAAGFSAFYIPWLQIGLVAGGVFVASVLTTVIPSRQASGIPPAEALRYE